jgi:protein required for attachment to host cells
MLIPHGTMIAVIDGAGLKLYRNSSEETHPKLTALPTPTLEGHSKDSGKRHRSSAANPDDRLVEEDSFIAAVADWLNHQALEGKLEHLAVVAAPRALGELRRHYHQKLAEKILVELHKDLIDRPVAELEAALVHAKAS